MIKKQILFLSTVILFDLIALIYGANSLSISYNEVVDIENNIGFLYHIINYFLDIFGKNDFALRAFTIILHLFSILLLYSLLSIKKYNIYDKFISLIIFILIPGVYVSGLLLNESIIIIDCILIFILSYERYRIFSYILLPFLIFIDNSFAILYFSLLIYGIVFKKIYFFIFNLILFSCSLCMGMIFIGGYPENYFIDIFGWYAILYSPFAFIVYFYAAYKKVISKQEDILLYISFFSFVFAIILSFRQNINIVDFVPFIVVGVPIAVSTIGSSIRVRLPKYRKKYIIISSILFTTILINYVVIVENKILYSFTKEYKQHFAYKYHIAKELANALKKLKITSITSSNKKLLKRLSFYGIKKNGKYRLSNKRLSKNSITINIKYNPFDIVIKRFYVTKLNTF